VQIDARIEQQVREALTAVIKDDGDRFVRAIDGFADETAVLTGARLALGVALYVLHDQADGPPTDDDLRTVAEDIIASTSWTGVTANEIERYLRAALQGVATSDVVPVESVIPLAFLTAGYLLSFMREDDEAWWDYLDRAEAALEAAPTQ
jgi:hypothetical protein